MDFAASARTQVLVERRSGFMREAQLCAYAQVLRLVDGADEVRRGVIARLEMKAQSTREPAR